MGRGFLLPCCYSINSLWRSQILQKTFSRQVAEKSEPGKNPLKNTNFKVCNGQDTKTYFGVSGKLLKKMCPYQVTVSSGLVAMYLWRDLVTWPGAFLRTTLKGTKSVTKIEDREKRKTSYKIYVWFSVRWTRTADEVLVTRKTWSH